MALANPFDYLFPELWGLVRGLLSHPWDGRGRVSLQRTCRAAHGLDPGLHLAPEWASALSVLALTTTNQVFRYDGCAVLMLALEQVDRARLWDTVFAMPERVFVAMGPMAILEFDLGGWCKLQLRCQRQWRWPGDTRWMVTVNVMRRESRIGAMPRRNAYAEHSTWMHFNTLEDAMKTVPMIQQGAKPGTLRLWAKQGKLESLVWGRK
jgi:hypothetical protein